MCVAESPTFSGCSLTVSIGPFGMVHGMAISARVVFSLACVVSTHGARCEHPFPPTTPGIWLIHVAAQSAPIAAIGTTHFHCLSY